MEELVLDVAQHSTHRGVKRSLEEDESFQSSLENQETDKSYPVGIDDFEELVEGEFSFIDKSLLVRDIMKKRAKVILITRPRRFGKTMGMSMIGEFLSHKSKPDLFKGLKISKDHEFCQKHQNKYPVIFLSLKEVAGSSFEESILCFKAIFSELYKIYDYLLEGDVLDEIEKEYFERIRRKSTNDSVELAFALKTLTSFVRRKHNIRPILLLDEYDTPIHSAYDKGYYDEMIGFMRIMLGGALKGNRDLGKAVVTGITKVSKQSLFSSVNNLVSYSLFDKKYGQYFGFTEDEVETLLPRDTCIEAIREWYNGYQVGEYRLYNPWSIMMYLEEKKLDYHWNNTSSDALVHKLIGDAGIDLKKSFENLIKGSTLYVKADSSLSFPEIKNNEDAIWTLLFHSGYLTLDKEMKEEEGDTRKYMKIPNKEVMLVYESIVEKWFDSDTDHNYIGFIRNLKDANMDAFFGFIKEYISSSSSYFDFSTKTPEKVFHVFMLGLLVGFRESYDISSNKEAGGGRYDIILKPKASGAKGIIMEFKVCTKEEDLEQSSLDAIIQIKGKRYTDAFTKGTEILCIGLSFCGKDVHGEYETILHS